MTEADLAPPPEDTDQGGCEHTNFQPGVDIKRFVEAGADGTGWQAEAVMVGLNLFCSDCGAQFEFVGMEPGMKWDGPHRSLDSTVAMLPMVPPGKGVADGLPEVDFGDPWQGKDPAVIEATIRRALETPQAFAMTVPNEGRNAHRARAIRNALTTALASL